MTHTIAIQLKIKLGCVVYLGGELMFYVVFIFEPVYVKNSFLKKLLFKCMLKWNLAILTSFFIGLLQPIKKSN